MSDYPLTVEVPTQAAMVALGFERSADGDLRRMLALLRTLVPRGAGLWLDYQGDKASVRTTTLWVGPGAMPVLRTDGVLAQPKDDQRYMAMSQAVGATGFLIFDTDGWCADSSPWAGGESRAQG